MSGVDVQIITTTLTVVGGLATTYIIYVYAKKKKSDKPKDRMDTIFDGYEKLIAAQQVEIERKGTVIASLENVVQRLEDELTTTRDLLNKAREELSIAREESEKLKTQLMQMKADYKLESGAAA